MNSLIEYVGILIPVFAAGIVFYTSVNVRLKLLEVQVKYMMENNKNNDDKYDKIIGMLNDLRVEVQNKQNRD